MVPSYSFCLECKRLETVCVMVAHETPCLGPVTQAGCGAICPTYHRGCYGCFGPMETPNTQPLSDAWIRHGATNREVLRVFRGFNAYAVPFMQESKRLENQDDQR